MAKKTREPKLAEILKEQRRHFILHLYNQGFSLNDISWVFYGFPRATIYKIIESVKVAAKRD